MPTFTTRNTDEPEINPETLTVNLLGPKPDPDNLVADPVEPKEADQHTESDPAEEEATDNAASLEPEVTAGGDQADTEVALDNDQSPVEETAPRPTMDPPKEATPPTSTISEIKEPTTPESKKRKIDPVVISSCILAVILIAVFVLFFSGIFGKIFAGKDSFNMTLDEFSVKYAQTSSFKAISAYGFAFPTINFNEDSGTDASSTDGSPALKTRSFYSDPIENTLNYQLFITGTTGKTDSQMRSLRVAMALSSEAPFQDPASFSNIMTIYGAYVQVLYPDMSREDAVTLLTDLYGNQGQVKTQGDYAMSMLSGTEQGYFYCLLNLVPATNADSIKPTEATEAAPPTTVAAVPLNTTEATVSAG